MTRVTSQEVKPPRLDWYVAGTLLLLAVAYVGKIAYNVTATQVESNLAPAQLGTRGEAANTASRALAQFDGQMLMTVATVVLLVALWVRFARKWQKYRNAAIVPLLLLSCLTMTGCGPAKVEQFVDVADHETGFLIPLEGESENQEKFNSKDFLQQNLIAAKRVSLPLRKKYTGRMPWDYEWIPTARMVTVTRTPEHREWTQIDGSKAAQVLRAQSSEGIKFTTGAVISALVTEDDSALFRSHFKNVPLEQILDTTVRGFCQERIAAEFGKKTLDKCQEEKSDVFARVEDEAVTEFHRVGITILYFGNHGGLAYLNDKVQTAIDSEYLQKLEKQIAGRKLVAQKTRNETLNIVAKAEADAASKLQEASEAMQFITAIEIAKAQAEARLNMAKKVNGKLPETILPAGSDNQSLIMSIK